MDWTTVTPQELLVALREVDWNQKPRPLSGAFGAAPQCSYHACGATRPFCSVPDAHCVRRVSPRVLHPLHAAKDESQVDEQTQVQRCVALAVLEGSQRATRTWLCATELQRCRVTLRALCTGAAYYYRVNYFCLVLLFLIFAFFGNPLAFVAVGWAALTTLCLNDSFAHAASERAVRLARKVHPPLAAALRNPQTPTGPAGRPYSRTKTVYLFGKDRRAVVAGMYVASGVLILWTGALGTIARTLGMSLGSVLLHATFRSPNLKARLNSVNEEFRAVWRGYAEA